MLTRYAHGGVTWVDMVAPTPAEVRSLMREFAIDPTLAEELVVPSYKQKVEHKGDALYVILHFPALRGTKQRGEVEIDFVMGKHFLITARYEQFEPMHTFAKAFEVETVLRHDAGMTHGGHLFVSLTRALYGALADDCAAVHHELMDVEEKIFNGNERRMVVELSHLGRVIHDFRQALMPHQEMLTSLEAVALRFFGEAFAYHLRALQGAWERVERQTENLREALHELRETNNSLLTTKQNDIMETFTVLAFIFLPLSFVAGLFGMNTEHMPFIGSPYDFLIVVGIMLAIALSCVIYFKRKGWL